MHNSQIVRRLRWILLLGVFLTACQTPGEAEETSSGGSSPANEAAFAYDGIQSQNLDDYSAAFDLSFTADGESGPTWSYHIETQVSPDSLTRSLSMEGVSAAQDPGDITLTRLNDAQYLTGEATEAAGCLIIPLAQSIDQTFLTPDNLLSPAALSKVLSAKGDQKVAGRAGTRYVFDDQDLGAFTAASGEIVVDQETGITLRYVFSGQTRDTLFLDDRPGVIEWTYEVTSVGDTGEAEVPEACQIRYPFPDDASNLTKLPGLITFESPQPPDSVRAYYEEALPAAGWERYEYPGEREGAIVLAYAQAGEILRVSIRPLEDGTEVTMFTEDDPAEQ